MVMDTDARLDALGFFQDGFQVLDIGSGYGYIPMYLMRERKKVAYHGIDIDRNNIQHCRNISQGTGFKFNYLPIQSDTYNPDGVMSPTHFTLPLKDKSVNSIVCHSLFTHLDTEEVASRYVAEITRVLMNGGLLWTTWFASPPNRVGGGTLRTVYPMEFIHNLLGEFEYIEVSGGETDEYNDQLEIACVKC